MTNTPNPTAGPIKVMVVDDDPIVRGALASYVGSASDLVVEVMCADGAEALAEVRRRPIDVVLMDVRMPQMDGFASTAAMVTASPGIRVLLLTSLDLEGDMVSALRAGAGGFLLKSSSPEVFLDAIRTVHRGASVVPAGSLTALIAEQVVEAPPADIGLSVREHEVLELLCAAKSNAEIADVLVVSASTVKSHVYALMAKLGVSSRLKAVVRAHELGLVRKS
ncbi:MAG: response regulator transcription factor [Micropruina sp.]|nr:response regulator transcription factor [Micropruina sp.]